MTELSDKKTEMISANLRVVPIGESQSLKARAYEALKDSILAMNIYDEDAPLKLDERDLSAQFGISRTPLREALAQLDQEGIVKVVSRRGIFIVRKTKAEILDMITVWAALEAMAARLATAVATDEELAALHLLIDDYRQDEIALRMGEYSDSNIAFHSAILKLAKCPLLETTADGLLRHVRAIRNRTIFEKDRAKRSIEDHRAIVDALVERDAAKAEQLVRDHTFRLREHVAMFVDIS
ncbi:MAG: GntR family transcriptional regulator [Pseudomonadota bacterium]